MNSELQQLEKMFRELQNHPDVHLILNAHDAWTFIALIQLALRHPGYVGRPAENVKKAMLRMQDSMQLTDEMKDWLMRGWDEQHDKPIQKLNKYISVRPDDFMLQNIAMSLAMQIAAISSNVTPEEMERQIMFSARQSLETLTDEKKVEGINDYYRSVKEDEQASKAG